MGIVQRLRRMTSGFTIVELLVVIVVIGILVSIVVVTYPGAQQRTRDNERKSDMSQLVAALKSYALQKNTFITTGSGCGLQGNGNGWISAGPSEVALYPKAISTCLQEAGLIKAGDFIDPSGCKYDSGNQCGSLGQPVKAYMKATCTKGGQSATYVFAYLEGDPRKDAEVDALCDAGTVAGFDAASQKWGTNYAMNYYQRVN
jgi:prepilin-type N-terminal cleavage/methylation domain-containing protein